MLCEVDVLNVVETLLEVVVILRLKLREVTEYSELQGIDRLGTHGLEDGGSFAAEKATGTGMVMYCI